MLWEGWNMSSEEESEEFDEVSEELKRKDQVRGKAGVGWRCVCVSVCVRKLSVQVLYVEQCGDPLDCPPLLLP